MKFSAFDQIWKKFTAGWYIYLEQPVSLEELAFSREAASIPSFGFFFLLISATLIATLGLLANSTAVIIGAMIVAPLMNPILSMSFAIVTANWKLYKLSIITIALGTCCAILISFVIGFLIPINIVGSEIIARTSPNLIDLGIAIAAGAAGAFSLTRNNIGSSIAGVAIAVALVPPLCVVGIGFGLGDQISAEIGKVLVSDLRLSKGAFLLFLSNLAGITFTACLVFLSQSYGNLAKAFQTLVIWLLIMFLLGGPLTNSLREFVISNHINSEIYQIKDKYPEISKKTHISYLDVKLEGTTAYVTVLLNTPKGLLTEGYLELARRRLFKSMSKMGVKAMNLRITIIPVEIRDYQSISE